MESNEFEELGSRIRILREKRDMTQLQLAEKLHVTRATIGHIELGNRMPSVPLLIEIAKFFDVTTDYLLGLSKSRGSRDPFEKIVSPLSETEYQEVLKYIDMIKCYHNNKGKSNHWKTRFGTKRTAGTARFLLRQKQTQNQTVNCVYVSVIR